MAVLNIIPSDKEIETLVGGTAFTYWQNICREIESLYDMETMWNDGGKRWTYEYKYRRGGKTLCALYARQDKFGLMIIFGRDEREKVGEIRCLLSERTTGLYDGAETYHDGKWVMFDETVPPEDIKLLLGIKRKPNRKTQ